MEGIKGRERKREKSGRREMRGTLEMDGRMG